MDCLTSICTTAILFKYSNFPQKIGTLDYGFLLRMMNTFTIDTDEYYLMCYKVNDTKTFKNLERLHYFRLCAHAQIITYVYCTADWLA